MNFNWPGKTGKDIIPTNATVADGRLKSVKRALKTFRKSVEDSLRTANSRNKNEDLDARKRRCNEFLLGENLSTIVPMLTEDKNTSPLGTILERYANFEMTIGHMLAANEMEIATFLSSDTPFVKLLDRELPLVQSSKKELEQLTKRLQSAQASLLKETAKLEKLVKQEDDSLTEEKQQQMKKKEQLSHDVEVLCKDLALEQDKLTSTLFTLVSRENRYASSFLEMMRIKKQFYENAYNLINAELPYIERILSETKQRPVFGEHLEDHLKATGKYIAYPILLSVKYLRLNGQNDEGLFRISPKQIKLDKVKAYIDANKSIDELLRECDSHLYSSLLKSYLRELPEPLLGRQTSEVYKRWIELSTIHELKERIDRVRGILKECLPPEVNFNIQYLVKFLHELSKNSQATKMTPYNLAIVLGPTLLWSRNGNSISEQSNIENIIGIVSHLIDNYHEIFTEDYDWDYFEDETKPPESPLSLRNNNNDIELRQARPTSSPPSSESPSHKRSNIFKASIFKSKTNSSSTSTKSTTEDPNGSPPAATGQSS